MEPTGPRELETLCGRIAVELGFVTPQQIRECVGLQDSTLCEPGSRPTLGALMVERGYMTESQRLAVDAEQQRRMDKPARHSIISRQDFLFGQTALRIKLITDVQLNRALRKQANMVERGESIRRIGEILQNYGWLNAVQIRQILHFQSKVIVCCTACRTRFNAFLDRDQGAYRCPDCGGTAAPIVDDSVSVIGTIAPTERC